VTVPSVSSSTTPHTISDRDSSSDVCTPDLTVSTTGGTPDPDGYTVTVGGTGGASQHIATNGGRVTFDNLAAGDHTVTLSDLAAKIGRASCRERADTAPAAGSSYNTITVARR